MHWDGQSQRESERTEKYTHTVHENNTSRKNIIAKVNTTSCYFEEHIKTIPEYYAFL